jgi:hypothetical protein
MKNKVLFGIAVLLLLVVCSIRFIFKNKLAEFEVSVRKYESAKLTVFQREKAIRAAQFSSEGLEQFFNEYFEESKSLIEKDTVLSFLYLSESVKFKYGRLEYFDCLHQKCIIQKRNAATQKQIELKENQLENRFGSTFTSWYPKLKDEKLLKKTNRNENCSDFYSDLIEISFEEGDWLEFEEFMKTYDNEIRTAEIQSKQAEAQFSRNLLSTKRKLHNEVMDYFDTKVSNSKSQILSTASESKSFNSSKLGLIVYDVKKTSFNMQEFQNVADEAFEEQWKFNSLNTGSMPYASCYGSSNYCPGRNCSGIRVITGGLGDVVVTIKNSFGDVVRHAYIEGGSSFTFDVPDGSYQVFFYSGSGWNPNKMMPSSSCSYLHGGFVSNEDVTKDNSISLFGQIMTYELILQEEGNFNTEPSSKNEAF